MFKPLDTTYIKERRRLTKRHAIRVVLIGLVLVLSGTYMVFQTRDLIIRPSLTVERPHDGETFSRTKITVAGRVTLGVGLTINGLPTYNDETGSYEAELLLPAGVHTIEVVARNRFGRERTITRQIVVTIP